MALNDIQLEQTLLVSDDYRRTVHSLYMGNLGKLRNIVDGEISLFTVRDPREVMGNHYHDYSELLIFLSGRGVATLEDVHTQERRVLEVLAGQRIYVPKEIAIALIAEKGSQILMIREGLYDNQTTHPYDVSRKSK